ncbi:unnamed protein product [Rangifer tarandus platyrhynchus]|uniref:Uncharacterized protein n=1 Tax=Rangifer tarandus platyrhynchus TaxID=3082113 RepID=A0AC59Z0G5_RANTA
MASQIWVFITQRSQQPFAAAPSPQGPAKGKRRAVRPGSLRLLRTERGRDDYGSARWPPARHAAAHRGDQSARVLTGPAAAAAAGDPRHRLLLAACAPPARRAAPGPRPCCS